MTTEVVGNKLAYTWSEWSNIITWWYQWSFQILAKDRSPCFYKQTVWHLASSDSDWSSHWPSGWIGLPETTLVSNMSDSYWINLVKIKDHLKHLFLFCLLVWWDSNCLPHFTRLSSLLMHHLGISLVIFKYLLSIRKSIIVWTFLRDGTFAFFQDLSLLRSYFSTSLPWLSKSTCMNGNARQWTVCHKKCIPITYLFCKFYAPLFPCIVSRWTPKPNPTAEKENRKVSFFIKHW